MNIDWKTLRKKTLSFNTTPAATCFCVCVHVWVCAGMRLAALTWRVLLNHKWLRAIAAKAWPLYTRHAGSHLSRSCACACHKVNVLSWFYCALGQYVDSSAVTGLLLVSIDMCSSQVWVYLYSSSEYVFWGWNIRVGDLKLCCSYTIALLTVWCIIDFVAKCGVFA